MNYTKKNKKGTMKLKDEVARDGRATAKKYTNKICRDNHVQYRYIPTLAF